MSYVNFKPTRADLFTPFEIIFWTVFLGIPTGLAIGGSLTKQDPPVPAVGWIILWAAVSGMYFVAVMFFIRRWKCLNNLRFRLEPSGLTVGWADDKYCVSAEAVEAEVNDLLAKMTPTYPDAAKALRGCVAWFQEPSWVQDGGVGYMVRRVAGVQDGQLILVGWREDLKTSALKHELAHRVLQVCAGDPVESVAHEMMTKMGLL